MKSFIKSTLAVMALIGAIGTAHAQSPQSPRPYGQVDLGAGMPSGNLGQQLSIGARAGLEFNKWFSGEFSLSQNFMLPATWLGGMNSTEFKLTPIVRYAVADTATIFAGPQIGAAMLSGPASTNTMVGTYGALVGVEFKTGWNRVSVVPSYEYTRSMQPGVITGPGYTDYYNNNVFRMGLRKTF